MNLVLARLAIFRAAEVDWGARAYLVWFSYTFGNPVVPFLPATASLRRVSASGERIEEGGMPIRRPEYHEDFAGRGMSKACACNAWKLFPNIGKNLKDLPMLGKRDAFIVEEGKVIAAKMEVAAVPIVDFDTLLDVKENGNEKLEIAVGLDTVERVKVKRKLCELQEKFRAERLKVPTPVAEVFTLANELFGSVNAHMSTVERVTLVNRGKGLGVKSGTMTDEQDRSRIALADLTLGHAELWKSADASRRLVDAQVKETREDHARKLDA